MLKNLIALKHLKLLIPLFGFSLMYNDHVRENAAITSGDYGIHAIAITIQLLAYALSALISFFIFGNPILPVWFIVYVIFASTSFILKFL